MMIFHSLYNLIVIIKTSLCPSTKSRYLAFGYFERDTLYVTAFQEFIPSIWRLGREERNTKESGESERMRSGKANFGRNCAR